MKELIDQPKRFRLMGENVRSNWLYQKYAVHLFADNIEHCINPMKQIWLDALTNSPHVAEFLPEKLKNDNDIITALLQHDNCQRYTRYVTFTPEQTFGPKWYSNDHAVMFFMGNTSIDMSKPDASEIIKHISKSRLPSQRKPLVQELFLTNMDYISDPNIIKRISEMGLPMQQALQTLIANVDSPPVPREYAYIPHIFYSK